MQETKRKLNRISTDVLLALRRLGNTVAITPICASDRGERSGQEEQTTHASPAASLCTAAASGLVSITALPSSREMDPSVGKDKAHLIPTSLPCTHCAVVRHRHITMIYRISCWSPATSWLHSQRSSHGLLERQRLQCSVATFPCPCELPCSSSPKAPIVFTHPPFGAAPPKKKKTKQRSQHVRRQELVVFLPQQSLLHEELVSYCAPW